MEANSSPVIADGVHGPVLAVLGVFVRFPGSPVCGEFSSPVPDPFTTFLGPL